MLYLEYIIEKSIKKMCCWLVIQWDLPRSKMKLEQEFEDIKRAPKFLRNSGDLGIPLWFHCTEFGGLETKVRTYSSREICIKPESQSPKENLTYRSGVGKKLASLTPSWLKTIRKFPLCIYNTVWSPSRFSFQKLPPCEVWKPWMIIEVKVVSGW